MIRFFWADDAALITLLKNILIVNKIECTAINLSGNGKIDFTRMQEVPEIWLHDPRDFEKAQRLIENGLKIEAQQLLDWQCPQCSERHARQFKRCWKCGYSTVS